MLTAAVFHRQLMTFPVVREANFTDLIYCLETDL